MHMFCLLLFAILQEGTLQSAYENWIDAAIHQIISKPKISQLIVFLNISDNVNLAEKNIVYKKIIQQTPVMSINLAKVFVNEDAKFLKLTALYYPRTSSVYVILQWNDEHNFYTDQLMGMLNTFVDLSPVETRPKCLVILFSESDSCVSEKVRKILLKAWDLKFLDFSILIVHQGYPFICTFNPFTKDFHSTYFKSTTQVFPDKLSNLNGNNITLPTFDYQPMMKVHYNNVTNVTKIEGYDFNYLTTFSKKLNFTFNFLTHPQVASDPDFFQTLFNKLQTNTINIIGVQFLVGSNLYDKKIIIGKTYLENKFIILAPVLTNSKVNLSMDVFIYLSLFPWLVICFAIIARAMKFSDTHWKAHNILRILLGGALTTTPVNLSKRIMFFVLLVSSMKYSTDAFTKLTDVELVHGYIPFDTAEDVIKSGFTVYAPEFVHKQSYNDPSEIISKLKHRIKKLHHEDCLKRLIKWKNCICIAPYRYAKYNVDKITQLYGKPIIKISKNSFLHDYVAFGYESGSPFVEKFNELMQRMIQAGVPKPTEKPEVHVVLKDTDAKESILLMEMIGILSVGYFISCVAFLIEARKYIVNRKNLVRTTTEIHIFKFRE